MIKNLINIYSCQQIVRHNTILSCNDKNANHNKSINEKKIAIEILEYRFPSHQNSVNKRNTCSKCEEENPLSIFGLQGRGIKTYSTILLKGFLYAVNNFK